METLIYSLILAAISGLTLLAYRHPEGYKKIVGYMIPIAWPVVVGVFTYCITMMWFQIRFIGDTLENDPERTLEESSLYITGMNETLDILIWFIVIGFIVFAYLFLLYKLPSILDLGKSDENL